MNSNTSTTPNKVLVVDDVQTNLTVFAKVVAQIPETEAICFTSANEALQWAAQNECVLIIVDQSMPELSGIEFISEVRGRGNSYTPIVMITGHSEKELQREALKRGASAFLGKPVDPVAFVCLARNLIQLRGARLETMAKAGAAHADQQSAIEALFAQERATIDAFAKIIDLRDPRTGDHCRRVAMFAEAIAGKMGLSMIEITPAGASRAHSRHRQALDARPHPQQNVAPARRRTRRRQEARHRRHGDARRVHDAALARGSGNRALAPRALRRHGLSGEVGRAPPSRCSRASSRWRTRSRR